MGNIDSNFKRNPGRYFVQVALATAALFTVLWVENLVAGPDAARAFSTGAIASTAFILFVSPHRPAAAPRRVLGGHGWAIAIAGTFTLLAARVLGEGWEEVLPGAFTVVAAGTVGVAILVMAITNTEHAPAAGTALAVAANGFHPELVTFVLTSILILSGVHCLIRHRLIDLY